MTYGTPHSSKGMVGIHQPRDVMFDFNSADLEQFNLSLSERSPVQPPSYVRARVSNKSMEAAPAAESTSLGFLRASLGAAAEPPALAEPPPVPDDALMLAADGGDAMAADALALAGARATDASAARSRPCSSRPARTRSFFAQHGAQSPIKFVHLVGADMGLDFRPYDLVVVSQQDAGVDYYTMSAAGLVHVLPNEPSEFIPLAEWMRQSTLFNMLRSIRFYKYYLHSKCFNLWRNNVRYKLYCQQRKKISHGLFLAKESFCAPLLELKTHMLELQQVKLLDLSSKSPFDCSVFVEVQQTKRQDASKLFDSCMEKIAAVVQRVCSDVTSLARSADGGDSPLDLLALGSGHDQKNKSMVALKQEEADRRNMLRRAEQERRMRADFVRLAAYVAGESLVNLAVEANSGVLPARYTCTVPTDHPVSLEWSDTAATAVSFVAKSTSGLASSPSTVTDTLVCW